MLSILNSKLSANKGILNTKQSLYNSKALQYDTTVNKNPILLSRQASYNTNITNKTILENQVKQKQSTYDRTYTEVFM